jgi:uncharacterized membrane protein
MLFRLLFLISLLGVVGTDATSGTDDDEERVGGEGFGNVVMLAVILGMVLLAAVVIIAALSLTGQFEKDLLDPRV